MIRVGQGYDVHKFGEGDAIVIGGVSIKHNQGMIAHSDGDVLLHALCDALLGAAAMGDIGRHFPDTDAEYKNADSRGLLKQVVNLIQQSGYAINNVDMTIIAQQPKMSPHIPDMVRNIAGDLGVDIAQVNVKATTTERLGFAGREEGIAAQAIALISD